MMMSLMTISSKGIEATRKMRWENPHTPYHTFLAFRAEETLNVSALAQRTGKLDMSFVVSTSG